MPALPPNAFGTKGESCALSGVASRPGARLASGLALLLACWGSPVRAQDCPRIVITADPTYPPLHWYDGKAFRGASIELTARVLKELGIPYEFRYVGPWQRVLKQAREGKVDMIVTLKDTPDRRDYLAFPATPAFMNPIAVFVAKDRSFPYAGATDLQGRQGGISKGNRLGGPEGRALEEGLRLEEGLDAAHNFAKLARGRIDYFITGLYAGQAQQYARPDAEKFSYLTPYLLESPNYMGFVKLSPCARHLTRFDAALARLVQAGQVPGILEANLRLWVASQPEQAKVEPR